MVGRSAPDRVVVLNATAGHGRVDPVIRTKCWTSIKRNAAVFLLGSYVGGVRLRWYDPIPFTSFLPIEEFRLRRSLTRHQDSPDR